jgi:hypothetical protein
VTVERADITASQIKVYVVKGIYEKISVGNGDSMKAIKG